LSEEIVARVKLGARWLWSQGEYTKVAPVLEPEAVALARGCVRPGMHVLDVAAGNGNFALEAARLGADVTATDMSPRMIELGSERSAAAGMHLTWMEADAESLPFPDASFDLVASVFGAMFAPRPELVAGELLRVVRPGGIVAMANYGPGGYLARLSGVLAGYSTTPAPTFPSPFLWGDSDEVRRRFAAAARVDLEPKTLTLRYESIDDWREKFAAVNPPIRAMEQILPPESYARLIAQCADLVAELNAADDGSVTLESDYLAVVVTSPRG
jgi:ubiquinone/menaquinone biosynthesis C-methylase UbiE